ncbi:MAG TPA: glycoside hydrolase family 3 C-terminal domain-containing protein [Candidatus Sulfotelmatobacter sp.]|jgi:beta-glucosidase|nr:glycoside hydrolase family 3 C-terminal domain-containing protein [Candidatus Sulfotelmatobacter sp.]
MKSSGSSFLSTLQTIPVIFVIALSILSAQTGREHAPAGPWMNRSLSPDERADLVVKEMTLDEKVSLLHGTGMVGLGPMSPLSVNSNGGAGYVVGVPRLGIPALQISDAAYGVRSSGENGRYSTALPDDLAGAASWDLDAAYEYGALIARELRAQGYNMTLGGGVNLTREPRNGRTFEYMGEDPVLAGKMVGQLMKGEQAQHVIGDIKHYAMNDQESGRNAVNVTIDKRSMRESDLLAFEIGLHESDIAAVMCAYNRVNGDFACENKYLLTDVLKKDWNFKGFVVSDWQGTHSTAKASAAGLDHEEPAEIFYGDAMKKAVESGKVPMAEIDDHVHRILRSMFATGVIDDPPVKSVVDVEGGFEVAQKIEEQSIVLLKNEGSLLPLDAAKIASIAVIGAHADVGMISGGGSAQVDPPGGNAIMPPGQGRTYWQAHIWFPTSPLKAIRAMAPHAKVQYDPGTDPASAATLAKTADIAIVFAHQWESEGMDLDNLSLPDHQDDLIAKVAAANPHTIVVLETGSPVTMPWVDRVSGILEAWYGGSRGAEALARVLFGEVNPSAKLPLTFPKSEADLPHPSVVKPPRESTTNGEPDDWKKIAAGLPAFQITYDEGLKVGYKWYDAEHKLVLFPFGFGLSYTTYEYSDVKVSPGPTVHLSFKVKNSGSRAGAEIAEVYAALPESAGEPPKRLVGWSKVRLDAGQSKEVTIEVEAKYLSIFNVERDAWQLVPGNYTFLVGGSSQSLPLKESVDLK